MNIWKMIYRISVAVVLLVGVAVIVRFFHPKWREYRRAQAERARLQEEIRLNQELIRVYKLKQERFKNDPEFVERMAHEIGLAKDNEIIFRLQEE